MSNAAEQPGPELPAAFPAPLARTQARITPSACKIPRRICIAFIFGVDFFREKWGFRGVLGRVVVIL